MSQSNRAVLDEFGQLFIGEVRDESFDFLQRLVAGKMADKRSKKLARELRQLSPDDMTVVKKIIAEAIDASLARVLNFFDVHGIEVRFKDSKGRKHDVCALSDGLAGELYGETGWLASHSKFQDGL